ncbi:glycoprotein [Rhizoctonia solani AG-3 Rhs1AP]|uniref:Glycoprotein n=2 Tax=Rhizoctonia solani AG-3 TaxID=1086053 RepID=A0A074RYL6_9AGAM|nr:glycoprotein [Rhizoctonia solani AG-3 Rhs1AP]KEP52094.1 glycoprotein [Rhizoctonia solani 123E]
MSLRALRSVPSLISRAGASRAAPRSIQNPLFRATFAPRLALPATRAFGATARRFGQGESDLSLSQKLHEEINFELQAAKANADVPAFLKEFQSSGIWNIEDVEGQDEVALVRTFGNETIRLLFSIADIDAPQEPAFEDVEETEGEEAQIPIAPIRCSIGSDQGALSIDALAQDGAIVVDNISFYRDAKLATELTSEADWKRRGLYIGPQFDHLDTNVQEEFERYLDERGIGADLALFIPDYSEYKEQKEYIKWLQSVKSFIDV